MTDKLIATNFTYQFAGYHRIENGSYLGRKAATYATIRRFLTANARKYQTGLRAVNIVIGDSYVSPWRAK